VNQHRTGTPLQSVESTSLTELTTESWKCIVLAGFLGGFAERLVPSLLKNLQSRVDNRASDEQGTDGPGKQAPAT
jgi:hypothetical protein